MDSKKIIPVLIGDIGGSNSRLSLVKLTKSQDDEYKIIEQQTLVSFQYDSISDLISFFLKKYKNTEDYPIISVLGIPAPVFNNSFSTMVNLPHWKETKGDDVAQVLGMKRLIFLNDFAVNGYGLLTKIVDGVDYEKLNKNPVDPNGPVAMIGAGTGLGHGFLVKSEGVKYYDVHISEGGHQDFGPRTDLQWKYWKFLKKTYNIDHVSIERACCGKAIPVIYKFLMEEEKLQGDEELSRAIEQLDINNSDDIIKLNPLVLQKGLKKECKICERVVEFFVEIYGAAAGNMSLFLLPTGGLYLLGGLSIGLQEYLTKTEVFWSNFVEKGRLKKLMEKIPIFVVKNSKLGVAGAAEYARRS